jgi:hypothetical protein
MKGLRGSMKTSVRIDGVPDKSEAEKLSNESVGHYNYTIQLSGVILNWFSKK